METRDDVRQALALLRGLVSQPESLIAIKLRGCDDIVVVERGAGGEGDLVAARLSAPDGQRTVLGRLNGGHIGWQSLPAHSGNPATYQVLGRVLSVIHPAGSNVQPQAA